MPKSSETYQGDINMRGVILASIVFAAIASIAATVCFGLYMERFWNNESIIDLDEEFMKDQALTPLSQTSYDNARKQTKDEKRARNSFDGANLALLSLIALNVIYYVHFR